jgi:tetratricopeptide (TPR) repeat protein
MVNSFEANISGWIEEFRATTDDGFAQNAARCRVPHRPAKVRRFFVWGGLAICLFVAVSAFAQAKFDASLDRDSISLGESATLTFTVENGRLDSQISPRPVPGLQYGGQSSQKQTLIDNGRVTTKTIITIEVRPQREGTFTIPAMQAIVDSRQVATKPLTLKVVKGSLPTNPDQLQPAFVRLVAPTNTIYVGETIPLEIRCYYQFATGAQPPQLSSEAFTLGQLPENPGRSQVNIRGVPYNLLAFRLPATPTKSGKFALGPASWNVTIYTQRTMWGQAVDPTPFNASSDILDFNVLPMPTNDVPPGFSGAVGRFQLAQFEAGPTTVAVGDPITLKVRVTGAGAFDAVTLTTDGPAWQEFKTYPPQKKFESSDPLQLEGSKYFEQVITPQNVGIKEIPAYAFTYFDPGSGSYRTLSHAPIPLNVLPGGAAQPSISAPAAPVSEATPPAQEIVNIKVHLGTLAEGGPIFLRRPGFLAWQLAAPLLWTCALIWRRQKDNLANNPRLRRRREVERLVERGLGELANQAKANDAEAFYGTVVRLLQEQLGERLDLPASAITEAVLDHAQARGLGEETAGLLRELFHACNQFRFAPEHTEQELASLIPKVKTALHDLQRVRPQSAGATANGKLQSVGCLLLLLAAASIAHAGNGSDQFDAANKLYAEGKYAAAAAAYEKMTESGSVSAAVFFNLGNAWFKAGQLGRAICAFRRAEELAPRDPDVRANLRFARNQGVGAPAIPGNSWTRWVTRLTLNEWSVLAAVLVASFFIVLTSRQIWPSLRKSTGGVVWTLAAAAVCGTVCLGLALDARYGTQSSVVVVPEAVVRLSPLEESQSVFTAHDGAELRVIDKKDGWLEVADAANHSGWVQQQSVEMAP